MFAAAYFVARFLWVPLLACWFAAAGARGRSVLWLPIIVGALATAWEAMIPVQANIRIDLMLVGPVLMFADGLAGLLLASAAYRQRAAALGVGAALCLAACAFFVFAWTQSTKQAEDQYREHVEGSRYAFEAAFRDDAAQHSIYGDLEGTRWAGYYVSDPPQPSYAHLVVNAAGDYFLFTQEFYERHGHGTPDPADPALLVGVPIYLGVPLTTSGVELRDLGGGRLHMRHREGSVTEADFVKKPPPRFPRPASASDRVRFRGVFSGTFGAGPKSVSVAQLWLWESEGRMWATWLRSSFTRGYAQPVFATRNVKVTCADTACATILLQSGSGAPEKLQWQSPDRLAWQAGGADGTVTLERGEAIPGLLYGLAPLATEEENQKWLRAIHADVTWKAPAT